MFILVFLLLVISSCAKDSYVWYDGNISEALSQISLDSEKILFLDFYSDNWGACVRLDAETLSNSQVVSFSKEKMISLKLKPWSVKEDSELFKSMNGTGLPLLVYLNSDGEEIDRILGYISAEEYLNRIEDIYNGVNTFLSLKNSFISGSRDVTVISRLSDKCKSYSDLEFCEDVHAYVINNRTYFAPQTIFAAELIFAKKQIEVDGDTSGLIKLINVYKNPKYQKSIYNTLVYHYNSSGDIKAEAKIYKEYSDKFITDANLLNGYAWRMTELQLNLHDALEKSTLGIDLTSDNPDSQANILDTKAELLWLLERYDEAISVIDIAININPNSDYFKEQKTKFQNSKNEEKLWAQL